MLRRIVVPAGLLAVATVTAATLWLGCPKALVLQTAPLVMFVMLTVLEHVAGRWHSTWHHAVRDGVLNLLNATVGALAPALVIALLPNREMALPFIIALPLALMLSDLAGYGVHRLFHAVPALWRLHAMHHFSPAMYVLMAGIDNPLFVFVIRASRALALTALGFSSDVVFVVAMLDLWQGLSSHLGIDTENPWLSAVLVTPQTHRAHHSSDPRHQGNYGLMLTLSDRLFGTFVAPERVEQLGLSDPSSFHDRWWGVLMLRKPRGEAS